MSTRAARFDDRLNALFVKEVRQALRGKTLAIAFAATVFAAVTVVALAAVSADEDGGGQMGDAVMGIVRVCCGLALTLLVPYQAFGSMAAERDENTHDLLALSNLTPHRIVFGKLGAICVWQGLFVCAFAPFFTFAFLLPGGDIVPAVAGTLLALVVSTALSAVAFALASRVSTRGGRVGALAALAGLIFAAIVIQIQLAMVRRIGVGTASYVPELVLGTLAAAIGLHGFSSACGRLASFHENRSSGPRIAASIVIAACLSWALAAAYAWGDPLMCMRLAAFAILLTFVFAAYFSSEPEPLGRGARGQTSVSPALALLQLPWMPGGARGLVWFGLHALLVTLACAGLNGVSFGGLGSAGADTFRDLGTIALYGFVYLGLVTFVLALPPVPPRLRAFAPILVFLVALGALAIPAFVGFLLGWNSWVNLDHPFQPFWVLRHGAGFWPRMLFVLPVAAIVLAACVPRLRRALRETLEASAARTERDRRRELLLRGGLVEDGRDAVSAS